MARIGKIARLPEDIREEVNRRLRAGQLGPQILPWLNEQPEAKAVLAEFFGGQAVNAQNLSDWRQGGYKDWEDRQSKTHRVKELAQFAVKLTEANGGKIAEGAAAIASGKILELLEEVDGTMDLDKLGNVVTCLTNLRSAEVAQQRTNIDVEKLKQKDQEISLARDKFQRETSELVLKAANDQRVQAIANSPADYSTKLNEVGKHLFGELWK